MGKWIQFGKCELMPPDFMKVLITAPYTYLCGNGKLFTVPKDFESDGASIPDVLESLAGNNMQGGYVPAAFLHDWLCYNALTLKKPLCSWSDAHKIFYQAMLDNGCKKWGLKGAYVKYKAVQFGMLFRRWKYND